MDIEVGTAGAFGRPAVAVDVGDAGIVVERIAADTGPGDARAAEPGFCYPATAASVAALFFSRAASKSTYRKSSPKNCPLDGGFGCWAAED